MKLIEFSFKDSNWEIQNLEFGAASLIVGKNATGKSRTLKQLSVFFKLINQFTLSSPSGKFHAKFSKDNDIYTYDLEINPTYPIQEVLSINNDIVLKREASDSNETALLLNKQNNAFDSINPPRNKLIIHVNRDTKKYPFLEDIARWAEKSYIFKFGSIFPDIYNSTYFDTSLPNPVDITDIYSSLNDQDRKEILEDLILIGYDIEHIEMKPGVYDKSLLIKENGIYEFIYAHDLSQGMLRSIYLLIFIKYVNKEAKASTIIIDDLCEGLDYERATKLGKLVYEKCREYDIQLIASSNDMFLMDVVDIQYWNVLQRKEGIVTAINARTHPDLFENFKYTGLSNFDFFSSDYIAQKIDK